jgi:large subunit ribosomal protein L15
MADKTITVTLVRSKIGNKPKSRGTLRALGLNNQHAALPSRNSGHDRTRSASHRSEGELTMRVDELAPAPGSSKRRKRVGRGIGGKGGKTAGRGTKGQYARNTVARGFEGGQMPLKQRVPKLKGFNNPFRVEYSAINLDSINALSETEITPEVLVARGVARKGRAIKVLARGQITRPVKVSAHAVSKAAEAAITAAGGSVTILPPTFRGVRPPAKGNQFTNR